MQMPDNIAGVRMREDQPWKPLEAPRTAYVVMVHGNGRIVPCFSAPTFERAAERVAALLRSQSRDLSPMPFSYYIAEVEGE